MTESSEHQTDYESLSSEELISRLREAEETLEAIRTGEVDAVVVVGSQGQQVYTLQNADRPYRVLVEQMQEGAITLSESGTILYCNDRFASLVGAPHDSVIGQSLARYFSPGEGKILIEMINAGSGAQTGEFSIVDGVGYDVPVNVSLIDLKVDDTMPRLVCGIVTDLTSSRMRTHELGAANARLASEIVERRKTEESLQLTLDAAEMGIWELDLLDNRMKCSARHDRIFGDATGSLFFDLATLVDRFVPEDRPKVKEAFDKACASGAVEFEHRIRRLGDNSLRWVNVKGRTFFDGERAVRITGVTADITQRRQVDEQLRQAQKMEAVGQLTGGIAHDFNNLLMIIGGSLDLLGRRIAGEPKAARLFDAARQAVARGSKLNQQLLAFSRRQNLQMEIVQMNDLIPTFETLLDRAVGETVKVHFVNDPALWQCRTDPHQLETAIVNLAINARDAMPQGGQIVIKTANRLIDEALASRWEGSTGEYAMISVADSGHGMSPEVLAHVFEPFFTTKDVGKGTGLGLSQVYGFAKQSGGFVAVASTPGQGTLIEVFLKRSTEARPLIRKAVEAELETGTGVVLVVEDDPDVRATTTGMLEDLGYSVLSAATGSAAIKIIEANSDLDLVFSDVVMPDGMSGPDLARQINLLRPALPVLLTSGYTAQRVIPETASGEQALLKKPFSQADLSVAIRKMLANDP